MSSFIRKISANSSTETSFAPWFWFHFRQKRVFPGACSFAASLSCMSLLMFEMGYLAVPRQGRQSSVLITQNGPLANKGYNFTSFLHIIGWDLTQLTICWCWLRFTALFNNMRTLKSRGQSTNAFSLPSIKCSTGPSSLLLLPSTASLSVLNDLITARSAVGESWEEPSNIWLTVAKNAFVGWAWIMERLS